MRKLEDLHAFLLRNEDRIQELHEVVEDHWEQGERRAASLELMQAWTDHCVANLEGCREMQRQFSEMFNTLKRWEALLEMREADLAMREADLGQMVEEWDPEKPEPPAAS